MQTDYTSDACQSGTVMALGNFDGIHIGHRVIIEETVRQSLNRGLKSSVLLLNPHPSQFLAKQKKPFLLTTIADKREMFKKIGVDCVFIEEFDGNFAGLSPEGFVQKYLVDKYQVGGVVVGFDYSFGHKGQGNTQKLQELGKREGFSVTVREAVSIQGETVSSSLIRKKLAQGLMEDAALFLGYPYHIHGEVIPGSRLGRTLGFPTANLKIDPAIMLPQKGVYLTTTLYRGKTYPSLTNVGFKPTVAGKQLSVEIHLLHFSGNLYGQELNISFLQRIRDERAFKDIDELKEQIARDILLGQGIIREKYTEVLN
jgi:riboflavin kinase / FMN adenylyltransferase